MSITKRVTFRNANTAEVTSILDFDFKR